MMGQPIAAPQEETTMPVKNEPTTTAAGGVAHYVWNDMTAEPLKGTITLAWGLYQA